MGDEWSQWLDFDRANIEAVPESAGVCVMHASMKVLYIGSGQNVRQVLLARLSDQCTGKAKRFRYTLTPSFESIKEQMLKEYAEKHGGQLPLCMGQQKAL